MPVHITFLDWGTRAVPQSRDLYESVLAQVQRTEGRCVAPEYQQTALQALRAAILALDIAGASRDKNDGPAANLVGHGGVSQAE